MPENLPYRRPCQGVHIPKCSGLYYRHKKALETKIDQYGNVTQVPNYDTITGGDIDVYVRWMPDPDPLGPGCEVYGCTEEGENLRPCTFWPRPFPMHVWVKTGTVDLSVCRKRGFKNVHAKRCWNGRFGYDNVEASNGDDTWQACDSGATRKTWRSYQSAPARTRYLKLEAASSWHIVTRDGDDVVERDETKTAAVTQEITNGILYKSGFSITPNELHDPTYTTLSHEALVELVKAFWHYGDVVGRMTLPIMGGGVGTTTTYGANSVTVTNDADSGLIEQLDWGGGSYSRTVNAWNGSAWVELMTESLSIGATSFSYSRHEVIPTSSPYTSPGGGTIDVTVTGTLSVANTDASIYADIKSLLALWDLADDVQYQWRTDLKVGIAPLVSRDELNLNEFDNLNFYLPDYGAPATDLLGLTLGDEGWEGDTGATVNPDPATGTYRTIANFVSDAMGTVWDLQLPGFSHTDAAITCTVIGGSFPPGISMTSGGHITGTVGDNGHWGVTIEVTCGVVAVTGEVLGAPLPGGYEDFFDWRFLNMHACCFRDTDAGTVAFNWFQYASGGKVSQFNSDCGCHLPLNCTQWTNRLQAMNKPQGAFLMYADPDSYYPGGCIPSNLAPGLYTGDGNFWGGKYAEILETWNSQNFALPAGDARFWFDEDRVYCATNVSGTGEGSVWALIDPLTGFPPVTTPEVDDYWGGPVVGGFYAISGWDGTNITLGAKRFDIPSNWKSKSDVGAVDIGAGPKTDEDSCFGPLRWPDAPAILGRAKIKWVSNESPIMIILDAPVPSLRTGDSIDISEMHDVTAANGTHTVTRIDDSTFTLDGTTGNLSPLFVAPPTPAGIYVDGNIDINTRPLVPHDDTIATILPVVIPEPSSPGRYTVIPLVDAATRTVLSTVDATTLYNTTGNHLGTFDTEAQATAYAEQLQAYEDATFSQKAWAVSTGDPNKYYMNDTDPKGDYVLLEWESDFRSTREASRLGGLTQCDGVTPVTGAPTTNAGGGPAALPFKSFTQREGCLKFSRCEPRVVCISPNGECFKNGITYGFPGDADAECGHILTATDFVADATYGRKWWAYVQATMTDLTWQRPHRPCNIKPCSSWSQDGGGCLPNSDGECPGDEGYDPESSVAPIYYYGYFPLVEARITAPCTYGDGEDECAVLHSALEIGWSSPVFHAYGDGSVAFPPVPPSPSEEGIPGGAATTWNLHDLLCANRTSMTGCRFGYELPGCIPT